MTDDAQMTQTASQPVTDDVADQTGAAGTDPSAPQKSPLDILEELLSDARGKPGATGAPKGAGGASNDPLSGLSGDGAPQEPSPEDEAAIALKKQQAETERQQLMEKQRVIDEQQLAIQREEMELIKNTPEYQARVSQDAEKKEEQEQTAADQSGYQIVQLQHKKI